MCGRRSALRLGPGSEEPGWQRARRHLELLVADAGFRIDRLANELLIKEFFTWRMTRCHRDLSQ